MNRIESDAAAALTAFLLGMLVLLCTTVLGLHFLSGLPPIMVYGIVFAVMVFAVVCGVVLSKTNVTTRYSGPPQLQFRSPVRRRRRRASEPKVL